MRSFQPPSTPAEVPEQMRRLYRRLLDFKARVKELPATATDADRNEKVNEIIRHIRGWVEG